MQGGGRGASLADPDPGLVATTDQDADSRTSAAEGEAITQAAKPPPSSTSPPSLPPADGMQTIQRCYQEAGYSQGAENLITQSWRPATQAAYNSHIAK